MAEVDLLDFLRDCKRFAIQALGTNPDKPAEGGLAHWKHLVIRGYRLEDDHSYRETENRLRCFGELREILELDLNDVPDFSTIYKSFDRFKYDDLAGVAPRFCGATPAVRSRRPRQHVLRARSCFVILPSAVGSKRTDAESHNSH